MLFTPFFQAWARRSPSRLFCTLSNLLKSKGSSQKCWYPCESSSALGGGLPGTIPQLPAALCRTRRYGNGLWLHKGASFFGFCHRPLESPPLHAFQHRRKVSSREGNGFPKSGNPFKKQKRPWTEQSKDVLTQRCVQCAGVSFFAHSRSVSKSLGPPAAPRGDICTGPARFPLRFPSGCKSPRWPGLPPGCGQTASFSFPSQRAICCARRRCWRLPACRPPGSGQDNGTYRDYM